jgi:ABC-type multidrug transport system fused ATPase/permease subunit
VLPSLLVFALALVRILPSVTRSLAAYNFIVYHRSAVARVREYRQLPVESGTQDRVRFTQGFKLRGVTFGYDRGRDVLSKVDLSIRRGSKIGVVGASGAGKSTLVDVISGLIQPTGGYLEVDDQIVIGPENVRGWRQNFGYIPQTVYLFDGTVADNVCMDAAVDTEKLERLLRQVRIWDFLQQKQGLDTRVGEGGVSISGGQRQRIAIARALYTDPPILIMDEGTSSLDSITEAQIIEEIFNLAEDKTVLMVAHRLSTLQRCDEVLNVDATQVTTVSTDSVVAPPAVRRPQQALVP